MERWKIQKKIYSRIKQKCQKEQDRQKEILQECHKKTKKKRGKTIYRADLKVFSSKSKPDIAPAKTVPFQDIT